MGCLGHRVGREEEVRAWSVWLSWNGEMVAFCGGYAEVSGCGCEDWLFGWIGWGKKRGMDFIEIMDWM